MIAGLPHLIPVEYDPEVHREEWLAQRRLGHGGSDVAAIVGEHPRRRPIDVWQEHVFGVSPDGENERTETGRDLEPVVLGWFSAGGRKWPRSPGDVRVAKPPSVYHRDRPWQRGSADGLGYYTEAIAHLGDGVDVVRSTTRPSFLIEVKTHGWFGSRGYQLDNDGTAVVSVPPDKRIQVAWYQALYEVDHAYLLALVDTHLKRTFYLPRDLELEAMLIEEVDRFRRNHILTGEPPPPDGTASYREYLGARFRTHGAELVDARDDDQVSVAVEALIAIKRDQKRLTDERELAEQVIKRAIGDAEGARTSHGIVTWRSQRSGKLRESQARRELYERLGMTDIEIAEFEARHAQPDHRVLRTPK